MNNVGIAILSYFRPDRLKKCVDALVEHTTTPFDLFFVDNASDEETKTYIRSVCKEHKWHGVFLGDNVGWTAGKNACLWLIKDYPIQVLMENDVFCRSRVRGKDWIQLHIEAMKKLGFPCLQGRHDESMDMGEHSVIHVKKDGVSIRLHDEILSRMLIFEKRVVDTVGGFYWPMSAPWGAYVDVEWGDRVMRAFSQEIGVVFPISLDASIFECREIKGSDYPDVDVEHKSAIAFHGRIFAERRKWIWEQAMIRDLKVQLVPLGEKKATGST